MGIDGILSDLASLGYDLPQGPNGKPCHLEIPACGVNAPHLRRRAWIVGCLAESCRQGLQKHSNDGGDTEKKSRDLHAGSASDGDNQEGGIESAADSHSMRELQPQRCEQKQRGRSGDSDFKSAADTSKLFPLESNDIGFQGTRKNQKQWTSQAFNATPPTAVTDGVHRRQGKPGKAENRKKTDYTSFYDKCEFRPRWTGREWAVSRVIPGFGGVVDGSSRGVLEGLGNMIVVPLAVEILKAILEVENESQYS